MGIYATLLTREFAQRMDLPQSLLLSPVRYGTHAIGGPEDAEIDALGSLHDVWRCIELLRCPVELTDDVTGDVWWGFVAEVEIAIGRWQIGVSIDTMSNRVAIKYNEPTILGGDAGQTAWIQDDDSVATYGTKALIISASNTTAAAAAMQATTSLAQTRYPIPTIRRGGTSAAPKATLHCRGWAKTADWQYYTQTAGYEAHTEDSGDSHKLGLGLTAATISFDASSKKITDVGKRFGAFDKDDQVVVTGSSSNNGTYTIASAAADGEWIEVTTSLVNESAGASVTVQIAGDKIAQSFALVTSTPWMINQVQVRVRKVGAPTDGLAIGLRADSAGSPGTLLDGGTIAAANIDDSYEWCSAAVNDLVEMDGTTYWLAIGRVGALSHTDYYEVALDLDAGYSGGQAKIQVSGSYTAPATACDLPFKVVGAWETTEQIAQIVAASCPFLAGVDIIDTSGISTPQYRDGNTTAWQEIVKLLELGAADGSRMLATVTKDRYLRIIKEPAPGAEDWRVDLDDVLRDSWDVVVSNSKAPAAFWMTYDIIPAIANLARLASPSRVFVDRTEFIVASNELTKEQKNMPSKWDIAGIRQG